MATVILWHETYMQYKRTQTPEFCFFSWYSAHGGYRKDLEIISITRIKFIS